MDTRRNSNCTDIEHISTKELYPSTKVCLDDSSINFIPFLLLCGEYLEFVGQFGRGNLIYSTNFRIVIYGQYICRSIPLGLVECVSTEFLVISIYLFTMPIIKLKFEKSTNHARWFMRLEKIVEGFSRIEHTFAYCFHAWCNDNCLKNFDNWDIDVDNIKQDPSTSSTLSNLNNLAKTKKDVYNVSFDKECNRMKFANSKSWRVCWANGESEKITPTYPDGVIVPCSVTDAQVLAASKFRTKCRFPAVVWRDLETGNVITRCSQPAVGVFGWRNIQDENFINAISVACHTDRLLSQIINPENTVPSAGETFESKKTMLIMDLRSYTVAIANRAKGGGTEFTDYYKFAKLIFMNIPNIHTIKSQFSALRSLLYSSTDYTTSSFYNDLSSTGWIQTISNILTSCRIGARAIRVDRNSVLVHCSDGWDRTAQVTSLIQLILDPYYRCIEGFNTLVDREWCQYGHKFADRVGSGSRKNKMLELSPIFVQWLDCVHQLLIQFPEHFEFNTQFLVKYAIHAHSNLFGNFMCNSINEARKNKIHTQTCSIFSYLTKSDDTLLNHFYEPSDAPIYPKTDIRFIKVWEELYCEKDSYSIVVAHLEPQTEGVQVVVEPLCESFRKNSGNLESGFHSAETPPLCPSLPVYNNVYDRINKKNLITRSQSLEKMYQLVEKEHEQFEIPFDETTTINLRCANSIPEDVSTISDKSQRNVDILEIDQQKIPCPTFIPKTDILIMENEPVVTQLQLTEAKTLETSKSLYEKVPSAKQTRSYRSESCIETITQKKFETTLVDQSEFTHITGLWSDYFDRDGLVKSRNLFRNFIMDCNQKYETQIGSLQDEIEKCRRVISFLKSKSPNSSF